MALGPVMVDLSGLELSVQEREILQHPAVGGVILFNRNYSSPGQVTELVQTIHAAREPHLLVAVDHEGGRVQRFRNGFTLLPPARCFGELYDRNPGLARELAQTAGWLMAYELRSVGVDFSFAPVLDLDLGASMVIGDRSFHSAIDSATLLAHAWMVGMKDAGMAATGKHFPGHGAVAADSHIDIPVDNRSFEDVLVQDIVPFERMIGYGLAAVMTAHVIYEKVDRFPATFSSFWIKKILRERLGFQGAVFSDDLGMEGASVAGDMVARAEAALQAGCDMIPVCNNPQGAMQVLDGIVWQDSPVGHLRLARMHGRQPVRRQDMLADPRWQQAVKSLSGLRQGDDVPLLV